MIFSSMSPFKYSHSSSPTGTYQGGAICDLCKYQRVSYTLPPQAQGSTPVHFERYSNGLSIDTTSSAWQCLFLSSKHHIRLRVNIKASLDISYLILHCSTPNYYLQAQGPLQFYVIGNKSVIMGKSRAWLHTLKKNNFFPRGCPV
jgi:hypothetical protein